MHEPAPRPLAPRPLAIAVTTYRRTEFLERLLRAIEEQSGHPRSTARILIVDNDPARSAEPCASSPGRHYIHEPMPGIAAARQAALDAAAPDELLVMIDDDLFPEEGWLDGLLDTWSHHAGSVVMGFVR